MKQHIPGMPKLPNTGGQSGHGDGWDGYNVITHINIHGHRLAVTQTSISMKMPSVLMMARLVKNVVALQLAFLQSALPITLVTAPGGCSNI